MAPSTSSMPDGGVDQRPLADALRSSTRSIHKRLNRLIMCRLPMALPPRASDPSAYATGLLHIAPIYMTFEALWQNILTPPGEEPDDTRGATSTKAEAREIHGGPVPLEDFKKPAITLKLGLVLSKLFLPGIRRTAALRRDLENLTGWSPTELDAEIRQVVSAAGALHDFTTYIRHTLEQRPHVLVAYSYIYYMALFAGGRFIRSSLESQGSSFWDKVPVSPVESGTIPGNRNPFDGSAPKASDLEKTSGEAVSTSSHKGTFGSSSNSLVNFLRFETPSDGEDLKEEFKKRLRDSESLLTEKEKEDIIDEAIPIFERMISIVEQLDGVFDPDKPSDAASVARASSDASQEPQITDRLRDSVVVTKERLERRSDQDEGAATHDLLSMPDEMGEDGNAVGSPRAIRFSNKLEHVPTPVVENPEKADSGRAVPNLDGTDDESDDATETQGLLQKTETQETVEVVVERQVPEEWQGIRNRVLLFFARLTIVATFTWLIILLTAMLLGRSEPFKMGCPANNPYNN